MYREKIKSLLKTKEGKLIAAILAVSVACYFLSGAEPDVTEDGKIIREDYGGGTKVVSVTVKTDSGDEEDISISVKSRQYTNEECDDLYNESYETICNTLLGDNTGLNDVCKNLVFFKTLNPYPFTFEWRVKDRNILNEDGKLIAHEEGTSVIYMTVSYNDWVREETFEFKYAAAKRETSEEIFEDVKNAVLEQEKESRSEETLNLPSEIDGQKISYLDSKNNKNPAVFLLALAAIVAILMGNKQDKRQKEMRKREMIIEEYSTVLQKMIMYLSAGMNIRNVWIRIYDDSVSQKRNNPIYTEMGVTVNELKNGVSEQTAYKGFSKRIGIPEITRFTTLLVQNLKKGSTNLLKLLSEESEQAFDQRKRRAKIKGEEAGTKLLVPMVLLMVMIMVIIMLPAFWSM